MVEPGVSGAYALGQIFEEAEGVITNEQVERVLSPVLERIMAGEFDGIYRRRRNSLRAPFLVAATAMVAVFIVTIAANYETMRQVMGVGTIVETLEHVQIERYIGGVELIEQIVPGYSALIGGDIRNVELGIADRQESQLLGRSCMCDENTFRFDPLPDGQYRALALLPEGGEAFQGVEIGMIVVADGLAQLVLSEGLENFWEGVDIQICLTGS